MRLTWTDELETGIAEIDAQNRRIVDHVNVLHEVQQTGDREQVGQVLEQLLDYAVSHFLFEEHLMEEAKYEFFSSHERIHEVFAKRLADFRGRYAKGEDVSDELLAMLSNWIKVHIGQEDQNYVPAVRQVIDKQGGQTWVAGIMKRLFG